MRMRIAVLFALAAIGFFSLRASGCGGSGLPDLPQELRSPPKDPLSIGVRDSPPPVEESQLANGLRVVTWADPGSATVAVSIGFPTGSSRDPSDQRGLAHLVEHLMYRHAYPEEWSHDKLVDWVGGYSNAFTSYDHTIYSTQVARNQLELLFWSEAHRLAGPSITDVDLETERAVVVEEYLLATEQVGGQWWAEVSSKLFGESCYGSDPHGDPSELFSLTVDDVARYCHSAHVANGAVLAVSGSVEHSRVVELAEQYLGALPTGPARQELTPPTIEPGRFSVRANVTEPTVAVFFPSVPMGHPDECTLDVLSQLLSSEFYHASAEEHSEVFTGPPSFSHWSLDEVGIFVVQAPVGGETRPERAFDELWRVIAAAKNKVLTSKDSEQALRTLLVWRQQELEGDWARAHALASTWIGRGQWKTYGSDSCDPKRLAEVAQKRLRQDEAAEFWVERRDADGIARDLGSAIERSQAAELQARVVAPNEDQGETKRSSPPRFPVPSESPPIDETVLVLEPIPSVERELPNGLKLVVLQNPGELGTSFSLAISSGARSDPAGEPGTAWFACHAAVMSLHTRERGVSDRWRFQTWNETIWFSAPFLPDERRIAVSDVVALLRSTHLGDDELQLSRLWIATGMRSISENPASIADFWYWGKVMGNHRRTLFGGLGVDPTTISDKTAREWWQRFVRPSGVALYAIGPGDPEGLAKELERELRDWKGSSSAPSSPVSSELPAGDPRRPGVYVIDRAAEQVQIRAGYPVPFATPLTRAVVQRFLGFLESGLSHGLGQVLRSKHGYTYDVTAQIERRGGSSFLTIKTATRVENVGAVLSLIREELSSLLIADWADVDLTLSPLWINGAICSLISTPNGYVEWLHRARQGEVHHDPAEHYREIDAVSATELARACESLCQPNDLRVVLVGPIQEIEAVARDTGLGSLTPLNSSPYEDRGGEGGSRSYGSGRMRFTLEPDF